jgi:hypothetical protein
MYIKTMPAITESSNKIQIDMKIDAMLIHRYNDTDTTGPIKLCDYN